MIIDELLDCIKDELGKREVKDVRIGLSYTGVLLDNDSLGLAYSFSQETNRCCEVTDSAGNLEGDAWNLAKMAGNSQAVDSSIGVATINAVMNRNPEGDEGDLLDFMELNEGDKIGMVGWFGPLVDELSNDFDLYIFERNPRDRDVYPDWAAERILPDMDACIITGTSVVNETIDRLLELSSDAREVAVLGPTTPLSESVFGEHGATLLGGMVVEDVDKALKIISQGGGTRKLGTVSKKVTIDIPPRDEYIY
ncbi:MAG: Rossmann-like domain-containing protein [Candidatus Hadarchaeia archaeon]